MQQIAIQLAQQLDMRTGTNLAQDMMMNMGMMPATPGNPQAGASAAANLAGLGGGPKEKESSVTANARTRVAESSAPR